MTCLKCGECCKGFKEEEGFIWMTNGMYKRHPKFHPLKLEDLSLFGIMVKIPIDGTCPYLAKENLCEIQDDKPLVCKLYNCQKSLEN